MNILSLDGSWKLCWIDAQRGARPETVQVEDPTYSRWLDASVPGEIHLDLLRAGLIDEPCIGLNVLKARWVEEFYWIYRKEFECPAEAIGAESWITFDGLDLTAVIKLNGEEIGKHNNSFTPFRVNVSGKLRLGENTLVVHIDSGLYGVVDKPSLGYTANLEHRLTKPQWQRKPQSSFGWDWAPRLLNVGITGSVSLEWTANVARLDRLVALTELSDDLSQGKLTARQFIEGIGNTVHPAVLRVRLNGSEIKQQIEIKPGTHYYEAIVDIAGPDLWWPVGHGPHNLYMVDVAVILDGAEIGLSSARVGFRKVRVNQDPHPDGGQYFILEVNNKKIFAKGGNFVPADIILPRIDKERYDTLTDLAVESNFNLLRVWGGGLYEADSFYALCDEKGIMVWQEFIFACKKYPIIDEEFYENVKAEAVYHIRRLASHASLVLWCGNNEMEWAYWDWGSDRGIIFPDYAFFHLTLPRLVAQEDPTRYYQPSSPFSPDRQSPNADHVGDQHPWSVGFTNNDFRDYRKMGCRFPNEGGILGPNSLPTMLACLPEGQRNRDSFSWMVHDNAISFYGDPSPTDLMLTNWTGKDINSLTVEEFTYWGGLVHGEGLREYCDNFRRRMFDSASAIFWMYNDTWPTTRSWTTVDYYLRRTPAFHPVRRALQPVSIVVAQDHDDIVVFGINDTNEVVEGELRYGIFETAGGYPLDNTIAVELLPNASTRLTSFPAANWKDIDTEFLTTACFAVLTSDGELVSRNRLFLPYLKDLKLEHANITMEISGEFAVFKSDAFVLGVCLDLNGGSSPADNFFDLYPDIPYKVNWAGSEVPEILFIGNSM
jgi:beta-mannosidase